MNGKRTESLVKRSGFALVLSLFLMSFVLMILLSMTVLVSVETRNSENSLAKLRAQEAARLGLMQAIGALQKHAGPDQRVTARADILGDGNYAPEAKYWTGVWDTTNPSAAPFWLVSGMSEGIVQANTSIQQSVKLLPLVQSASVGPDPENFIFAPEIDIKNLQGQVNTKYAWWISDEGIKASIGKIDRPNSLSDTFFTNFSNSGLPPEDQKQMLRQQSPRQINSAVFFSNETHFYPNGTEDITSSVVANEIQEATNHLLQTLSISQLQFLEGIISTELQNSFHDLTLLSKGILSDTDKGGLKKDLSDQTFTYNGSGLTIDQSVMNFLWNSSPDSSGAIPLKGIEPSIIDTVEENSAVNTTPPIITEFSLYFVASGISSSSKTAKAFLRLEAELWSPYGFRHNFAGSSGSNTPELIVEFENLPDITLSYYDKDTDSVTSSTTLDFTAIDPVFELDLSESYKSGEIRRKNANWPVNVSTTKNSFYYTNLWEWTVSDPSVNSSHRRVSFPIGDSINYQSSEAKITAVIKNMDGDILQRIVNIPYSAINTDFGFYEDSPSGLDASDAPIAFYYRMFDDRISLETWLTKQDPRSLEIDVDNGEISELIDLNDQNGNEKGDPDIPSLVSFSNLDRFHGQPTNNFYRLFDVPATIPISVGVLQHLQFKGKPPYSIGNTWGETKNAVFDQFFISGIPQNANASYWNIHDVDGRTLPNKNLEIYNPSNRLKKSDLFGANSAKHLLNNGAFNVNSTSILAWQSMLLANNLFDWKYTLNKGTSSETSSRRLNLESAFFRLPFSGQNRPEYFNQDRYKFPFEDFEDEPSTEDDYPYLTNSEKEITFRHTNGFNPTTDWKPSLTIGQRELSKMSGLSLATEIVSLLKTKRKPFPSMEAFINNGLLQKAIDRTSINTIVNTTNYEDAAESNKIPLNAPAFLSQADILSSLAPKVSTRSDTFKIRSSGQAINPQTGAIESTVVCEVLIQRIPERIDKNNSLTLKNATGFGRKFKIIDLQWLNTSQL